MKKKLLIILLCGLCVTAFAQKPKTGAKKGGTTTKKGGSTARRTAGTKPGTKPSTVPSNKPVTPVQQPSSMDTTKKVAALPAKPFDRPLDGYYKKTNILSAKVTPYANLREADVVFQKRIWQEIDVREKMNQYMASPKSRLIDVLMDAINAGELTAYDPTATKDDPGGDKFSKPLTPGEAKSKMADSSLVTKRDSANNVISSKMVVGEFDADSIVRFRIKEDWLFDKQRSVYEPRIIGIAPLVKPKAVAGVELDLHLHSGSTSPRRARYWLPKRWLTAITMLQA
jgi:hypothetical protein